MNHFHNYAPTWLTPILHNLTIIQKYVAAKEHWILEKVSEGKLRLWKNQFLSINLVSSREYWISFNLHIFSRWHYKQRLFWVSFKGYLPYSCNINSFLNKNVAIPIGGILSIHIVTLTQISIKLIGVQALYTIGTATISNALMVLFCLESWTSQCTGVIRLEELGKVLNDSNQAFKLQFNKTFNIFSGYLSLPTRIPPIAGLLDWYSTKCLYYF